MTHPRQLLSLIKERPLLKQCQGESGFSLPLVLVTALALLLGGLALANRANQSLFGALFLNQSWEAREAAEIGMARIASELNKQRNRGLLIRRTATDDGLWLASSLNNRRNPCLGAAGLQPTLANLDPGNGATTTYDYWYIQDDGSVTSTRGNATRRFRLKAVRRDATTIRSIGSDSAAQLQIFSDRPQPDRRRVILEVEGQAIRGSTVIVASSATMIKQFELTPKCCSVTFGGAHGNLNYTSSDNYCIGNLGLGLLGGTALTNTGEIDLRGKQTSLASDEGTPINTIYCLADNTAGCTIKTTATSISVDILDPNFPPAPTYANPNPQGLPNGPILDPARNTSSTGTIAAQNTNNTNTNLFLYSSCTTRNPSKCSTVINAGTTTVPTFCSLTQDNPATPSINEADLELHCNISSFSSTNEDFFVQTSNRKLRLYFPESGQVISLGGTSSLQNCSSIAAGICTPSGSTALATDFSLFGSNTNTQQIDIRGTSETLKLFAFFPRSVVNIAGANAGEAKFEGILWTDDIVSSGNVRWIVPGSGLASALAITGIGQDGASDNDFNPLLFDYVLRGTDSVRWVGG